MAAMEIWQRRVLPQGGVVAPQDKSGEIIGNAVQELGQAGARTVGVLARVEQEQQQKNDSAWLGQQKPQSMIDLDAKMKALNDPNDKDNYIDPTSDDYEQRVAKAVDDYASEAVKKAPSQQSSAELGNYISSLKVGYTRAAGGYSDEQKLGKRLTQIAQSEQKWGGLVVSNPNRYGEAVQQQEALIRSQGLGPDKTDAALSKMRANLAGYAMNGEANTNPQQFLKSMDAWVEKGATPTDIAQAQNIAVAEQKRRESEAKAEAARARMQAQVSVTARADDAISSVQNNGGVMPLVNGKPLITEQQIRTAFADDPVRAQRAVDKLNNAMRLGQAKAQVSIQTMAEDNAMIAAAAPAPGGVFTEDDAAYQQTVIAAVKAKRDALSDEISQDIKDSQGDAADFFNKHAADALQTVKQTGVVPDDIRTAAIESGAPEAKSFLDKLEQQARLTQAAKEVEEQPNSADRSLVDRLNLDVQSTGPGSADRAGDAVALAKAIEDKQKAISTDPGAYFSSANLGVKAGWDAVDANPDDLSVAQNTVAMSVAAQSDYGLSRDQIQPFPNARAARFADTISTAQPDQALSTIDYVRSISGDAGLRQVLGQKGVPAMAKFLAFADQPSQEPIRSAALQAMQTGSQQLDKLVKDRGVKDSSIEEAVTGVITPLLNTLPTGSAVPYHDAMTELTKFYVAKGMTPENAAQQAWSAFDQAYAFHDTFRVPRQINGNPVDDQKVQDGMNSVLQNLDKFNIVPQPGGPRLSAPLPSNPDLAAVVSKFPALAKVAGNVVVTDKPDPGDGRQLESYPPWESENPNPGKFTSEIYNQSAKGDERTSLIAGDMLHYLGAVDPETNKPVDPEYRALKERLLKSMTPDQSHENHSAFKAAKERGDIAPQVTFDDFMDFSRGDEFIMGYVTPDKADEWRKSGVYTPEQTKILDEMKGYLAQGSDTSYVKSQTIKQLQTGGARWATNADDTGVILTYDVDQNGIPGAAVKTTTGRLEISFTDLESGKYGFVSVPPPAPFPNTPTGGGYSINPLGTMKPKGGKYAPNEGVINLLKGQ